MSTEKEPVEHMHKDGLDSSNKESGIDLEYERRIMQE